MRRNTSHDQYIVQVQRGFLNQRYLYMDKFIKTQQPQYFSFFIHHKNQIQLTDTLTVICTDRASYLDYHVSFFCNHHVVYILNLIINERRRKTSVKNFEQLRRIG